MTFEFDAEKYKKASPHQRQWGKKVISELDLKGNERILDLGCGDGGITAQLAELVPNGLVTGIDASQSMIDSAQKNHKAENMRFDLMDINTIDFEDEFDIIFSNAALQWVIDHKKLLANVYHSLKPNGIIRFNFAGDGNCTALLENIKQAMTDERFSRYFDQFEWPWYLPAVDEYTMLVNESRFVNVRIWQENADRYFASADEITRWIDQPCLVPFLKCITGDDKQRFRDSVVEKIIAKTKQPDGTCFETFRRINVFAQK